MRNQSNKLSTSVRIMTEGVTFVDTKVASAYECGICLNVIQNAVSICDESQLRE